MSHYIVSCLFLFQLSLHTITDMNQVSEHLPIKVEQFEKLVFPESDSEGQSGDQTETAGKGDQDR